MLWKVPSMMGSEESNSKISPMISFEYPKSFISAQSHCVPLKRFWPSVCTLHSLSSDISFLRSPSLPPKSCPICILLRWKSMQIKNWTFHKRQKLLRQLWGFSDSGIASYHDWTEVEAMSRCWCSNGFAAISVKLTLMQATAV